MHRLKIGLIGCGRISKKHFEAISLHSSKFELVAVCDNDNLKLSQLEIDGNLNKYISLDEMLKNENLDIVTICSPSGYHSEHAIMCAKKGINVVTEKPMATKYEDALNMVNICKENKVKLFVVKQNRYNQTLVELKKAIDDKRFGDIKLVTTNVFWHRDQSYYDQADWRGTLELDGGALMNQASHYVDLLSWFFGSVKSVNAISSKSLKIEAEDTIVLNIEFQNGAIGTMNVSMLAYDKNFEGSITILGEKGLVRVGGLAVNKIEHWQFEDYLPNDKIIMDANYNIDNIYGKGHSKFYEQMYEAMNNKNVEITYGEHGLKSLEIILAAYKSVEFKKTIDLPIKF